MGIIKKNVKELWGNKKLLVLFFVFLIFSQFTLQYKEVQWPKLYMLLAIIAFLILLSFSRINNPNKIAKNAFVLIMTIGILNALILPIRQNLDENTHYYHALEVADGKIRNQTNEKNFLMISPDFLAVTKLPSKPEYKNELNTNLYHQDFLTTKHIQSDYKKELLDVSGFNNPVYIPSALGIRVGRLISDKIAVSYYLGRIFNLFVYAILAWAAIKISKRYKLQIFLASMIPYTIWISAGFSYDNLYYGLCLLILAQVTNFFAGEHKIKIKQIIFYSLTCLGLIFCKAPTILLIFLPLFVPKKYYASENNRFKAILISGGGLFLGFIWLIQGELFQLFSSSSAVIQKIDGNEVDRVGISYFLSHPIYSIELILRSFSDMIITIFESIQNPQPTMMRAGSVSILNGVVFIILFILVTLVVKIHLNKTFIYALLAIFLVITLGTFYAITGDPRVFKIGDLHISGVQGRYHFYMLGFLPLLAAPYIRKPSFVTEAFNSLINENKLTIVITKVIFILTVLNTTVALYGYL